MSAIESQVLCLLGMHRSGTSLVAGWLNACGLSLGDNLLPWDFSNKAGHFEDVDFLSLHKEVMKSNELDISGLNVTNSNLTWSKYHSEKRHHLVDLKSKLRTQWGWKEPRTCLFIDEYRKEILNLKMLVVHRPAAEVIQSLLKRDWKRWKKTIGNQAPFGLHPKLIMSSYFREKIARERMPAYITSCEAYFESLIKVIEETPPQTVITFTLSYFLKNDKTLFDKITQDWHFNLVYSPAAQLFNPDFMGSGFDFRIEMSPKLRELDDQLNKLAKQ